MTSKSDEPDAFESIEEAAVSVNSMWMRFAEAAYWQAAGESDTFDFAHDPVR